MQLFWIQNRKCGRNLKLTMKRKVLSTATKLRQLPESDKFAKVYIRPDQTPKQQEASKNLWEALKAKRILDPRHIYKIKRGVIIQTGDVVEDPVVEDPAQV